MTSVRVPPDLLAALRAATPAGGSLRQTIALLLDKAGGPEAVRAELQTRDRRQRARANGRRLRARGARSACIEPEFQEALAEAAAKWSNVRRSDRLATWEPATRTVTWVTGPHERDTRGAPRVWTKRGLP